MKTQKILELERRRIEIIGEARDVMRELQDASGARVAELEKKHSDLMRDLDLNQLDIDEERMEQGEEQQRANRRPGMGGEAFAMDEDGRCVPLSRDSKAAGWADQRGNPVRVLAPRESFADERYRGPSLGNILRAMVTGPRNDAERRALAEGTDSAGGYTVPVPLAAEFIDRLRAQSVVFRAGARTVPMTSETLAIARLETDPTMAWRAENAEITASDPTFGRVLLEAKSLAGLVKVSRELLDDSVNISEMLERAFTQAAALEFDRAILYGTGADDQPTGIATTSGINEVSMGTNGAALASYDKLIDTVYEMQVDNAGDPTAAIWHPRTGAAIAKLKDGNGLPLTEPEMIGRIPKLRTTAIPITETQGSSSVASSIIFGDFRDCLVGLRSSLRIELLRERYADYHQYGFLAWMRGDVQLAHKASFSRLKGIIPAS